MAAIVPSITGRRPVQGGTDGDTGVISWSLGNADVGNGVSEFQSFPDRSVHVFGTFGAATVTIEGSIDGTNWATLTDPQGNALTFTAARIEAIEEATPYIRASSAGGAGTALTVLVFARRNSW